MADDRQIEILMEGVEKWKKWREENPEIRPDLSKANLRGALLDRADLHNANLIRVDLTHAFLHEANLCDADLASAKLIGTNFCRAHLCNARLGHADLHRANLDRADLTGADLSDANLERAMLVRTKVSNATFTRCRVYGVSAWDLDLTNVKDQSNLRITRDPKEDISGEAEQDNEPARIMVNNLEVAQFIYLLLHNERIRDVIDTIGKKGVLIIGRFTEERKTILHAIRDELQNRYDLLPIMFEFDPLSTEPTIKTLSTLAHLSRFVIADLTEAKSVLQELTTILHGLSTLPVQPILYESAEMPPMADSFLVMQSVLDPYIYSTKEKLIADLDTAVVGPAQNLVSRFESKLAEIRQKWLPWQSK
jgi:uncharacterized protein YjbI with pentapeptide repeats